MTRVTSTALVLVSFMNVVSCTPPERDVKTDTVASKTSQPSSPVPDTTPVTAEQEIYMDSIAAANPVIVRGRARTFENAVSLRVRDERGEMVAEEHVTSVGEMGRHNPFEASLWIVRDPGKRITVDAFEYSAEDGSVRSLTSKTMSYEVELIRDSGVPARRLHDHRAVRTTPAEIGGHGQASFGSAGRRP